MHDLHSNEASTEDGVWLTPDGTENILSVKLQQHAMHWQMKYDWYADFLCMFLYI